MERRALVTLIGIFSIVAAFGVFRHVSPSSESPLEISNITTMSASYIVQADSLDIARQAVEAIGAEITHELGIINAVGAKLSSDQLAELNKDSRLRI